MNNLEKFKPFIYITFAIVLFSTINNVGAISHFLNKIFNLIAIFVYGMFISVFLNPALEHFEKHSKLSRIKSILILYISLIIIVSLLLFWGVPSFINNIRSLTEEIPGYMLTLNDTFTHWSTEIEYFNKVNFTKELTDMGQIAMKNIEDALINSVGSIVKTFSLITGFLVALILSGFFLAKKEYFITLTKELISLYFSEKNTVKLYFLGEKLNEVFLGWLHGKTIDSLIIGTIAFIALFLLKIPYAVFLGVAVYITNYVPYLGPFVGIIISATVTFFTVPEKIPYVIITLFIIQQFDAWYLEARCFKKTLKLDMFWGIAAVLLGGAIGGPIWIVLMIPTFALIKDMYLLKKETKSEE